MAIREASNTEMFSVVRDILLDGQSVKLAVKGQSMLPFFRSGSNSACHPKHLEIFLRHAGKVLFVIDY